MNIGLIGDSQGTPNTSFHNLDNSKDYILNLFQLLINVI